jgi:hypothetical protein
MLSTSSEGWVPPQSTQADFQQKRVMLSSTGSSDHTNGDYDFIPLVDVDNNSPDPAPLRKYVLRKGTGDINPSPNSIVSIHYNLTLPSTFYWSSTEVVRCWLKEQQGFESDQELMDAFIENQIDSEFLCNPDKFNEEFVSRFVSNKIRCKKLVMSSRRLSKELLPSVGSTECLDSSYQRGKPYTLTVGSQKVIKAMDITVRSMKVNEICRMVTRCDYAYGKDGLRTSKGDIIVPPYATLQFDIQLLTMQHG